MAADFVAKALVDGTLLIASPSSISASPALNLRLCDSAKGRAAAQAWLSGFIEEMKASGFVAGALQRHDIQGAAVAPPGQAPGRSTPA